MHSRSGEIQFSESLEFENSDFLRSEVSGYLGFENAVGLVVRRFLEGNDLYLPQRDTPHTPTDFEPGGRNTHVEIISVPMATCVDYAETTQPLEK